MKTINDAHLELAYRLGESAVPPDATSTYKIVPSSDFIYYQPGDSTTSFYKIDVSQTTGAAWSGALGTVPATVGGGGNTFYPYASAPFFIYCLRGNATASFYQYNIGTNTWATNTTWMGSETFTTGASGCLVPGRKKLFIAKESSQRCHFLDLMTGVLEPAGQHPYAAPSAYDGKRAIFVETVDGVEWIYLLRAGGQELFRMPIEWL